MRSRPGRSVTRTAGPPLLGQERHAHGWCSPLVAVILIGTYQAGVDHQRPIRQRLGDGQVIPGGAERRPRAAPAARASLHLARARGPVACPVPVPRQERLAALQEGQTVTSTPQALRINVRMKHAPAQGYTRRPEEGWAVAPSIRRAAARVVRGQRLRYNGGLIFI